MKFKKFVAFLTAAAMTASLGITSAFAAKIYTPVQGENTEFTKYLIMDAGDHVPNATFSFTVAPGAAISTDTSENSSMQVIPGPTGTATIDSRTVTTPYIRDVTFTKDDTTSTATSGKIDLMRPASARGAGLTAANGVEFEAGEKYASHTATIQFDGITYDEPGIYRYIVTETASAEHEAAGIMHDNDVDRVLDVYVTDSNGSLAISSIVMHTDVNNVAIGTTMGSADVATDGAAVTDKTDGFTNEYNSKDLVFRKEVTGNQASQDKWFELTAKVENLNDDDVFTVSLGDDSDPNTTDGNADAQSGTTASTRDANRSKTNVTQVTGAQLKTGVKFYLQHTQYIAIRGLAPNARYTITEDAEDYKSTGAAVTGYTDATYGVIGTIADAHAVASDRKIVKTSYLNQRQGTIPTGISMQVAPGIVIAIAAIAVMFFFGRKKNKKTA